MVPLPGSSQSNTLISYYNQIPSNTLDSTMRSAILSFVVSISIQQNISSGLNSAILGGTTTIIYALISPIFRYVIQSERLTRNEEIMRACIAYVSTGCLALAITGNLATINNVWIYALYHFFLTPSSNDSTGLVKNLNHTRVLLFF